MQTAADGERLAGRQIARGSRSELVLQIATCRRPAETAWRPCRFQSITAAKTPVFNQPISLIGSCAGSGQGESCETRLGAGDVYGAAQTPTTARPGPRPLGPRGSPCARESVYYGAEMFHEAARGRTIFASRIRLEDSRLDRGTWQMEGRGDGEEGQGRE